MKSLETKRAQGGETTSPAAAEAAAGQEQGGRSALSHCVQTQVTGQHHAGRCPAPPRQFGAAAEAPPWPAPKVSHCCKRTKHKEEARDQAQGAALFGWSYFGAHTAQSDRI